MVAKVIKFIIILINNIGPIFEFLNTRNKQKQTEELLKEDQELANAIKRGDTETVEQIRIRRKKYKNI